MKWLHAYENDLKLAFEEAEERLAHFPESFRQPALDYLNKFNVFKEKSSKNYICYLLPYWLNQPAGIRLEDSRKMTVANIFIMLYYHLIDAAMDEPRPETTGRLPMAELIYMEFTHIFSSDFSGIASFWTYHKKYTTEWAEAVSRESSSDFFYEDPVRMGHKAAPIKGSVAGSLLLADRAHLIPRVEQAVDTVLTTLQLLDDWDDWEKDLRENSYNALISVIQTEMNIPRERRPTSEEVQQGIWVHGALWRLYELANQNHEALKDIQDIIPDLFAFHSELWTNLLEGAEDIDKERQGLLQAGGLGYWLSKNMK